MDYGSMIGESFEYAKEAVVGKWNKWLRCTQDQNPDNNNR
jgi:hypothetical protein